MSIFKWENGQSKSLVVGKNGEKIQASEKSGSFASCHTAAESILDGSQVMNLSGRLISSESQKENLSRLSSASSVKSVKKADLVNTASSPINVIEVVTEELNTSKKSNHDHKLSTSTTLVQEESAVKSSKLEDSATNQAERSHGSGHQDSISQPQEETNSSQKSMKSHSTIVDHSAISVIHTEEKSASESFKTKHEEAVNQSTEAEIQLENQSKNSVAEAVKNCKNDQGGSILNESITEYAGKSEVEISNVSLEKSRSASKNSQNFSRQQADLSDDNQVDDSVNTKLDHSQPSSKSKTPRPRSRKDSSINQEANQSVTMEDDQSEAKSVLESSMHSLKSQASSKSRTPRPRSKKNSSINKEANDSIAKVDEQKSTDSVLDTSLTSIKSQASSKAKTPQPRSRNTSKSKSEIENSASHQHNQSFAKNQSESLNKSDLDTSVVSTKSQRRTPKPRSRKNSIKSDVKNVTFTEGLTRSESPSKAEPDTSLIEICKNDTIQSEKNSKSSRNNSNVEPQNFNNKSESQVEVSQTKKESTSETVPKDQTSINGEVTTNEHSAGKSNMTRNLTIEKSATVASESMTEIVSRTEEIDRQNHATPSKLESMHESLISVSSDNKAEVQSSQHHNEAYESLATSIDRTTNLLNSSGHRSKTSTSGEPHNKNLSFHSTENNAILKLENQISQKLNESGRSSTLKKRLSRKSTRQSQFEKSIPQSATADHEDKNVTIESITDLDSSKGFFRLRKKEESELQSESYTRFSDIAPIVSPQNCGCLQDDQSNEKTLTESMLDPSNNVTNTENQLTSTTVLTEQVVDSESQDLPETPVQPPDDSILYQESEMSIRIDDYSESEELHCEIPSKIKAVVDRFSASLRLHILP